MNEEQLGVFAVAALVWAAVALVLAVVIHHIHFGKNDRGDDQ